MSVKINNLIVNQYMGLRPGQCMVDASPAQLRAAGIEPDGAMINPASRSECSLISERARSRAEEAGLGFSSWNPLDFLVLCFSATLREHLACFVDRGLISESLEQLQPAFPALVESVRREMPMGRLTRALRALSGE
jgi:type III secretory pathway component EscV